MYCKMSCGFFFVVVIGGKKNWEICYLKCHSYFSATLEQRMLVCSTNRTTQNTNKTIFTYPLNILYLSFFVSSFSSIYTSHCACPALKILRIIVCGGVNNQNCAKSKFRLHVSTLAVSTVPKTIWNKACIKATPFTQLSIQRGKSAVAEMLRAWLLLYNTSP